MSPFYSRVFQALFGGPAESGTHMHIIGSSGSGKTKFLQYLMRNAFYQPHGFAVLDWHGTLYNDLLAHFARFWPSRPIYLIDPSQGRYITPYNPFIRETGNVGATASHFVKATVKAWGSEGTNQTPQIEQVAGMLFQFVLLSGETLPNAHLLLQSNQSEVLRYALNILEPKLLDFMSLLRVVECPHQDRSERHDRGNRYRKPGRYTARSYAI